MYEGLINMINSGKLSVNSYFIMAPYISSVDTQYRTIPSELDYFEEFNVVTCHTILHLAKLAKIAIDDSIKLLVVTGYQGTGKTNFLKYCEAIIKGKATIKQYSELLKEVAELYHVPQKTFGVPNIEPDIFDEEKYEASQNEAKTIKKEFADSFEMIKNELRSIWPEIDDDNAENKLATFFKETLAGNVVYFDFDADKRDPETPLELKLTRKIEDHLLNGNSHHIEILYDFYIKNKEYITKAFENRFDFYVERVISLLYERRNQEYSSYKNEFIRNARNLSVDQLLCIEVLLNLSEQISGKPNPQGKIFYILDNIDLISGPDNATLIKTIGAFWNFVVEMQSLMHSLQNNEYSDENRKWITSYANFKYIFAMRETTSMHIGDHLRTRIESYANHIDISLDVNKSLIIKKRYKILHDLIKHERITNPYFIKTAKDIERLTEDKYFKWSFFLLFNNDYRTALAFLCEVCKSKVTPIDLSAVFLASDEAHLKFGGRGVMIKALCDAYKRWDYFNALRISTKNSRYTNYPFDITLVRIILTVLKNLEKDKCSADGESEAPFFVMRENSVSIRQLFEKVCFLCGKTRDEQLDNYLYCIETLFSARNWHYWNHLITFDNAPSYFKEDFIRAINGSSGEKDIFVRCTKAGEQYLNTLCIHYEFFSSRYAEDNNGLFCLENQSKKKGKYIFESQIEAVYNSVQSCCLEMIKLNNTLLNYLHLSRPDDLLDSIYVKDSKFHEERIIHGHISYLEAFRRYLIEGPLKADEYNINKKLTNYIKLYLDLLCFDKKQNLFYSDNSKLLYEELLSCVEQIESNEYLDHTTHITRQYYRDNIANNRVDH